MKPLFTIHAGEYLVGSHIEHKYPKWNVWVPSKDTGTDLLVSSENNKKTVSLQVKFSKDFTLNQTTLHQSRLLATGWWTHDPKKIEKSEADFWIFVLPSFEEKKASYIIIPPKELLRRFEAIHGTKSKRIQSYFSITKTKRCFETRGLAKSEHEYIELSRSSDKHRDFSMFLNAWDLIEKKLK